MSPRYGSPVPAASSLTATSYYSPATEHNLHHLQQATNDHPRTPAVSSSVNYSPHLNPTANDFDRFSVSAQPSPHDLPPSASAASQHDLNLDTAERYTSDSLSQNELHLSPSDPSHSVPSHIETALSQDDLAYLQDSTEPRPKRSKVSRACDECRRKKIRCDSAENNGAMPCANCTRTSAICLFSRQPQKRGPARGYIKKLADRLVMLEHKLTEQTGQGSVSDDAAQLEQQLGGESPASYMMDVDDGLLQNRELETTAPSTSFAPASTSPANSRKRTQSMSEMDDDIQQDDAQAIQGRGMADWSDSSFRHHAPPLHLSSAEATTPAKSSSTRHAAAESAQRAEMGHSEPETHIRTHPSLTELNDAVLNEYYRLIHPTFPLLPLSRTNIRDQLARCPAPTRQALITALDVTVRTCPRTIVSKLENPSAAITHATATLALSQHAEPREMTFGTRLVYLQALVLMAIQADNGGPASLAGRKNQSMMEWLGSAIGVANRLRLPAGPVRDKAALGSADSDTRIGRRVWWIIFILERWHSLSCGTPTLMINSSRYRLTSEDRLLLGEHTYHLARLSFTVEHISQCLDQMRETPSLATFLPMVVTTLSGQLDRFRESVESLLLSPSGPVHLAYWHLRLITLRLAAATPPHELVAPATRIASILQSTVVKTTPLNHHFASLSAMTLLDLCEYDELRGMAERGLRDILESLEPPSPTPYGWAAAIRDMIVKKDKRRTAPLERLADVAVGASSAANGVPADVMGMRIFGSEGSGDWDMTALLRQGCLEAFIGES